MAAIDANIWGLLAMPAGLLLCFGPVLIAWAISEARRDKSGDKPKDKRQE